MTNLNESRVLAKLHKQYVLFCYALSFFSRVPISKKINFDTFPFSLGNAYFPFVGVLYALFSFLIFYCAQFLFDTDISCLLMLVAGILFTGSFHEDGFADCCDAFGGGYNKEQRLKIMKDSQIGTYAAVALILLFALKFYLLSALAQQGLLPLFCGLLVVAILSRYSTLIIMQTSNYAREDSSAKSALTSLKLPINYFIITSLVSLLSLLLLPFLKALLILVVLLISSFCCRRYFYQQIGGYTGDCLGFTQQLSELLILLVLISRL